MVESLVTECFIGHNFGDYKNQKNSLCYLMMVLQVTILETTKTRVSTVCDCIQFYRSQFWRLQKLNKLRTILKNCFIGHNFGDYKNDTIANAENSVVLQVTILETTKTNPPFQPFLGKFYRSQFWRLQKLVHDANSDEKSFIGHNFGDYKNLKWYQLMTP